MGNILDYLDWRGDLTFYQSPFNEVDNLLLSQLPYIDFSGIVKNEGMKQGISIREASRLFFETHDEAEILKTVSMTKNAIFVLKKMAESVRFAEARLFGYCEEISKEEQSQFAVLSILLGDGSVYVSFSGTDETIVGWHEDFNMAFLEETPAHQKAVKYMKTVDLEGVLTLRLGGHSKGGNLAIYAAMHCDWEVKRRILRVYNNDGPGFSKQIIHSQLYRELQPLIHTIIPESSVVGMLFEHMDDYRVVRSSNHGLKQHDVLSWMVLGTDLIEAEQVSRNSLVLDEAMKNWLSGLKHSERQKIVQTIFHVLDMAEIQTVDDLYNAKWETIVKVMKAENDLPAETKKMLSNALRMFVKEVINARI